MSDNVENVKDLAFWNDCKRISNIYNYKETIQLVELETLFIKFTEQLFMRVFNVNREPVVEVVDSEEYAGCHNGYTKFELNRKLIRQFQEGKALELFETICHEFNHFAQKRKYQNINVMNSVIEKDDFLKNLIAPYYDDNYKFMAIEVDSFLSQSKDAIDIMTALGIVPSDEEIAISNARKEQFSKHGLVTDRVVGSEIRKIDEVFEEKFVENSLGMDEFDKKNFLEFRPCINLEYKIVNNEFVRKSAEEIEQLYNEWLNGTIQLQGIPNEIDIYFKYTLERLKNKESELGNEKK